MTPLKALVKHYENPGLYILYNLFDIAGRIMNISMKYSRIMDFLPLIAVQ